MRTNTRVLACAGGVHKNVVSSMRPAIRQRFRIMITSVIFSV
jgi:hypothetical protein